MKIQKLGKMKTRKIKIILDGSILFGPDFPKCSTIFEIPDNIKNIYK